MGPDSKGCFICDIDFNLILVDIFFKKTHFYDVDPFPFDSGYPVPIPLADTSGSGRDRSSWGLKWMSALTAASATVMVPTITVTMEKKSNEQLTQDIATSISLLMSTNTVPRRQQM